MLTQCFSFSKNKVSNANALLQIRDYTKEQGSKAFKKLCFLYRPKEKMRGKGKRKYIKEKGKGE